MRTLGVFNTRGSDMYARGMLVIARTQRGLEAAEVLCEATEQVVAHMEDPKGGQILREQNDEDVRELRRLFEQQQTEHEVSRQRIAELNLPMQLVDVERLYGGERIVVYYLSEDRVDFRELVKVLAKEFQTRVEMRQIGVRDEAKLLADYGDCGKPVCCNTHLSEMPPVSMRMAKLQKATLDPSKISGRCGRLKCCLRYEYDVYQELQKDLPPVGSEIITNKGRGRVLAQEILAGQLLIETEDMRRLAIDAAEVLTVLRRGGGRGKPEGAKSERGEREEGRRSGSRPQPPQAADGATSVADGGAADVDDLEPEIAGDAVEPPTDEASHGAEGEDWHGGEMDGDDLQ